MSRHMRKGVFCCEGRQSVGGRNQDLRQEWFWGAGKTFLAMALQPQVGGKMSSGLSLNRSKSTNNRARVYSSQHSGHRCLETSRLEASAKFASQIHHDHPAKGPVQAAKATAWLQDKMVEVGWRKAQRTDGGYHSFPGKLRNLWEALSGRVLIKLQSEKVTRGTSRISKLDLKKEM